MKKFHYIILCIFFVLLWYNAIGSVRVAFTPTANANTVVQENAYYPFGAVINELSYDNASLSTNRYKREGKEYISDFSWNKYDYTARTFDPWNGQALQLDPMAEAKFWLSPYNLFSNNPVGRIDPNGMLDTDYGLAANGMIIRITDYNDKPDRLFTLNKDGRVNSEIDPITVDDKNILKELSFDVGEKVKYEGGSKEMREWYTGHRTYQYDHARYTETGSKRDAFNVYKFVSDNSSVEWALNAYNINGNIRYALGTQQSTQSAISFARLDQRYSYSNLVFAIHTHPQGALLGASGYPHGQYGDLYNFNLAPTKPHFIYNITTSTLFQYNQRSSHFNSRKIINYKSLMNYAK